MESKDLTKSEVWVNFRDNYYYYLDESAPTHMGKTARLFKLLIEEQGVETTNDLLEFVCKKWDKLKMKYRLSGLPGMGVIWGYRTTFIGDMREAQRAKNKRRADAEANKGKLYLGS